MNIKTTAEDLDTIAQNYHLNNNITDKFIEDICQEYCCEWLESLINDNKMNILELDMEKVSLTSRLSQKSLNYTIFRKFEIFIKSN